METQVPKVPTGWARDGVIGCRMSRQSNVHMSICRSGDSSLTLIG